MTISPNQGSKEDPERLESHLRAVRRDAQEVQGRAERFYKENPVESAGVEAEDYARALDLKI